MDRKRAPTGADFEHMVLRPKAQYPANPVQLVPLRLLERLTLPVDQIEATVGWR